MTAPVTLNRLDAAGMEWAQSQVAEHHYLHAPVPGITRPEGWMITIGNPLALHWRVGCLLVCRPQATRCGGWYGSLNDVATGWATSSRWAVLNLARVWLHASVQAGGVACHADAVPGYVDRHGVFRSTLASTALRLLAERVGFEYLLGRPPCFLDQPYEHEWLLSYCDTRLHRGTIYRAAGWTLHHTNALGIQTWRVRVPAMTPAQHAAVRAASQADPRAQRYRAAASVRQEALPLTTGVAV